MATINERIADEAVDHSIDLIRFSNGVVRRMIAILNRADAELSARLAEALENIDPSTFTVERLEVILASVRAVNSQAYSAVFPEIEAEMLELAKYEADYETGALRSIVPAAVQIRVPVAGIAWEQVYAAALSRPFQGRLLRDWASNVEASRMTLIRNAVRMGFVEGKTTADIVRQIRGTKALRYEDGILNRARRELQTIVNSALSHTAAMARQMTADANTDLIKAVKWVATLDSRTSPMCRARDGKEYTPQTHRPIGHKLPWGDGPGKLHFNCRSVSAPVTKSWRELGIDMDELPEGTRASMDGQVPADQNYAQWFAKQSAARQDEIVGPTRGALFRAGKVTFDRFTDDKGKWLTLEQLFAREADKAAAFAQPKGEFKVYDVGYAAVKPDISTPARRLAVAIEDEIRRNDLETGVFVSPGGLELLRKTGLPNRVSFTEAELSGMAGATFTHNHPGNGTFSAMDIEAALGIGLAEVRAVGPTLRHIITTNTGWPTEAQLLSAIAEASPVAQRRIERMIGAGDLEPQYAQSEIEHQVWLIVSEKLKFRYIREKS